MGEYVDRVIKAIEKSGKSKASSIAIGKSKGLIVQAGKHLATGPKAKVKLKGSK